MAGIWHSVKARARTWGLLLAIEKRNNQLKMFSKTLAAAEGIFS